jgi:serine/threonine protein kinase/WD40 repeat protein
VNEADPLEEVIFNAARQFEDADKRRQYLDLACEGNPELRQRLEQLLGTSGEADAFFGRNAAFSAQVVAPALAQAPAPTPVTSPLIEQPGTRIGRYKLLEQIGEGGFGVVFLAEQEEPVRRRVALKLIKLGMDTKLVLARFEAERQALALMDHPNIAKILDGGATDTGRPYFVMELVQGVPITEFCDKNQLSVGQRLKLFVPVCEAIQSAHQKGIIHRDLKPTNILVSLNPDGSGFPKVIDFGVAKATDQKLTEKTLFTAHGMMVGTPAYMSPEQAEMSKLDVDTRADIYGLGALLYELLTGTPPFPEQRLRSAGYNEMQRIILEEQPERPSTRLSTLQGEQRGIVARNRGASELTLGRGFPSDLDWIVMKCLEKDRARRYETANGLTMELRRHLNNEPVLASPPSALYRFQKLARRHKLAFGSGIGIAAALAAGIVASTFEAVRARRAEALARQAQANEAKQKVQAQQFLYSSLMEQAHAMRLARPLGYRDRMFALLKRAKALDVPETNLADLRREAVASMGDFIGLTPVTLTNFSTNIISASMDATGNLVAFRMMDRSIELRQMTSGRELARLSPTNGRLMGFCLNSPGDRLFAWYWRPSATGIETPNRVQILSPDANGLWQETEKREPPEIMTGFVRTAKGTFAVIVTPVNKGPDWHRTVDWRLNGEGSSGWGVELLPHDRTNREPICTKIRLLDPHTSAFVPGFEVTNAVPPNGFMRFRLSLDGRTLAVETCDSFSNTTWFAETIYNWENGKVICELPRTLGEVLSVSPDGTCIACLSSNSETTAYTVPNLQPIGQFRVGADFYEPCFSRNTLALRQLPQNRIRLWNVLAKEDVAVLDEPDEATPAAFTADGNCLLTHGVRHARLYRRNAPEKLDLPAQGAPALCVAFSPDGRCLAAVDANRVLQVSDALTGQILWETNDLLGVGFCLDYSPDGRWLATSGSANGVVSIRDAQTGRRLLEVGTNGGRGGTGSVQFSPNGQYLATGRGPTGLKIWTIQDTNGGPEATLFKSWERGASVVFAPNSRSLAFTAVFTNNQVIAHYVWDFLGSAEPRPVNFWHAGGKEDKSFTLDSRHLIAWGDRGAIVTADATSGERFSCFWTDDPRGQLLQGGLLLRLSPDGSKLAVSTVSHLGVNILDPKTGRLLCPLPEETGPVQWLAWSPDSRRLAISRGSGNIAIWNLDGVEHILAQLGLEP